ncbi:MAG TPA: UDP-2,3-diacylglucosamine diphosphatase LpxI [bacterium]
MAGPLGLIAGAGQFPIEVAREARREGKRVVAAGLAGWVDPALSSHADAYEEIAVGALARLLAFLKTHGVREAVMAGKVTKQVLFDRSAEFDRELLAVLGKVRDYSVTGLLGAVGERLAADGITLLDSSTYLRSSLCPPGVLTAKRPTPGEEEDIRLGRRLAKTMAQLDVGQTVAVKQGIVVAVEALEGTDAAMRRAQALAGGGLVIVKAASPQQDRRFDLPVVGLQTIAVLAELGASCLAVEAGATLLLNREEIVAAADRAGVSLVGVDPASP